MRKGFDTPPSSAEAHALAAYADELRERNPFKAPPPGGA